MDRGQLARMDDQLTDTACLDISKVGFGPERREHRGGEDNGQLSWNGQSAMLSVEWIRINPNLIDRFSTKGMGGRWQRRGHDIH